MYSENRWSRRTRLFALMLTLILFLLTGCGSNQSAENEVLEGSGSAKETDLTETTEPASEDNSSEPDSTEPEAEEGTDRMIYARVNGKVIKILAADNSSADAFLDLLKTGDVTVEMRDYGGFEKVGALGTALPRNDEQITTEPGDVILYQGNQITIYYDVNSWSFTRLGKVQELSQAELKDILGSGDATITFSLRDGLESRGGFDLKKRTVLLNSGYEMPVIGLGTWTLSDDEAENSVYGKSSAQVILRWQLQAGFIAIPGSSDPHHIAENYDIFDFELTPEEMELIRQLDHHERYENW